MPEVGKITKVACQPPSTPFLSVPRFPHFGDLGWHFDNGGYFVLSAWVGSILHARNAGIALAKRRLAEGCQSW